MKHQLTAFLFVFSTLLIPSVQAQSLLERILSNPTVQRLIGQPAEVVNVLNLCNNPVYQRTNAQTCLDAGNAERALKLPLEMRTVMSSQKSAQSMRDLCLAAQTTAQRDSYLCAELAKADSAFGTAMQGARVAPQVSNPGNEASN